MPINTTIASLSTNPALNGPEGTDLPSALDDGLRYALSFIAQLRDGLGMSVGMVNYFAGNNAPAGWLKLNGALVSRTAYAALWTYAQAQGLATESDWTAGYYGRFSVGDGSTTFRLPDTRGMFLRGLDESRGVDVSRAMGFFQDHENKAHGHGVTDPTHHHDGATLGAGDHSHGYTDPGHEHTYGYQGGAGVAYASAGGNPSPTSRATGISGIGISILSAGNHAHNIVSDFRATGISIQSTGSEARPKNIAWPLFVKF